MRRGWIIRGFIYVNIVLFMFVALAPSFMMLKWIYFFNTVIFPAGLVIVALMFFFKWRAHERGRDHLLIAVICAVLSIVMISARIYMTYIEPNCLKVRKVVIETDKVSRPLRILHISDIQSGRVGSYEINAFRKMKELKPDIVLNTGDLLQPVEPATFETELPKMIDLISSLKPRLGVYGVLGDVDGHLNYVSEKNLGNMHLLKNESIIIKDEDGANINLMGLSCMNSFRMEEGTNLVERWVKDLPEGDLSILIGHRPDYIMNITNMPIDLCLAGHTHGGQVRIPLLGPIITMSHVPRSWARGFRKVGNTRLNVSAGVGCEHTDGFPAMRLFCPPEITVIDFIPEGKNP